MNTVCKGCNQVIFFGYEHMHDCPTDGDEVKVRQVTKGTCGKLLSKGKGIEYSCGKLIPCSIHGRETKVSMKPVDSAGAPLAATTLTLGDEYYGTSFPVPVISEAARNRIKNLAIDFYRSQDRAVNKLLDGKLDWKPSLRYRIAKWFWNVRSIKNRWKM